MMVFLWLAISVLTAIAAASRGRSSAGWFILGLIFSVLALIAVLIMPSRKGIPTPETHLHCPDCREFVLKDARKCKHCGTALSPPA